MKQLFLLAALPFLLCACFGNSNNKAKQAKAASEEVQLAAVGFDDLLPIIDTKVDDTVTVTGYVTHTCKHSGRRCFIVGESQETSFRVEAKGEIGGFNRELVGSKLAINGIIKEYRLSKEAIAEREKKANQKKENAEDEESCESELKNVEGMRKWMKEHNKNYYAIYYMDGLSFEVLE